MEHLWIDNQPKIDAGWELARRLKDAGYTLAICTNNWLGVMENLVKQTFQFRLFDDIIDSSQEKVKKPSGEMYSLVEERLSATSEQICFIDDSQENLSAAEERGWRGYLYEGDLYKANETILSELL